MPPDILSSIHYSMIFVYCRLLWNLKVFLFVPKTFLSLFIFYQAALRGFHLLIHSPNWGIEGDLPIIIFGSEFFSCHHLFQTSLLFYWKPLWEVPFAEFVIWVALIKVLIRWLIQEQLDFLNFLKSEVMGQSSHPYPEFSKLINQFFFFSKFF
jgi:hypothetical protein